jgi:hypothetical protein
MRVYRGDPRGACLRGDARMRGFPHSNDPEETMKGELWAGVTPSGWSPVTWIPVKRNPEGSEAKGRGLDIKPNETQTPVETSSLYIMSFHCHSMV